MPETTSCPECDKKLKVPENLLGKKVKCPGCSTMFTARADGVTTGRPAPARRRDDDDEEDRPRSRRDRDDDYDDRRRRRDEDEDRVRSRRYDEDDRRRRRDDDEDDYDDRRPRRSEQDRYDDDRPRNVGALWRGVKGGINLWVMGAWLMLATLGAYIVALIFLGMIAFIIQDLWMTMILGGIVYGLVLLAFFAAFVMEMIGMGLCMQAPSDRDHPTRGLAIACFCCHIAPIVIGLLAVPLVLLIPVFGALLWFFLMPLNIALGIAGVVLWVLFLRSCAYQARSRDLAERLMNWLITWIVFMVAMIVLYGVMFLLTIGAGIAGGVAGLGVMGVFFMVIGLAASIFGLCLYIWLVQMASEVRDVVGRKRR
jgi:hypothetical protein